MNKKKVLTIIFIVILVLIAIFLTSTIRKMIILKDLNQKVSQYTNSKNYYEKIINSLGTTAEYYSKENNAVLFLNSNTSSGEKRILKNYFRGNTANTYIESGNDKQAILNSNGIPGKIKIIGLDIPNNLWQLFTKAVTTSIKTKEYNGKDCYILDLGNSNEAYLEKETGLRIKAKEGDMTVKYSYEFNNVNDSIFNEPDIKDYKLQNNK